MPRRTWAAQALMVIEGLKGKSVAELCPAHHMSQAQDSHWRDQVLAHAAQAFESHQSTQKDAHLAQENTRLKPLVGELTVALKNSDELLA
jgi:putative transposase